MKTILRIPVAIALCVLAVPAFAGLNGDTVTCTPGPGFGSLTIEASAVIVHPGVEFTLSQPGLDLFSFDFNENFLTITALAGPNNIGVSSVLTFGDLDWIGDPPTTIIGLAIEPGSAVITPAGVSFTDDSLTVDLCCGYWEVGDSAIIQILTDQDPVASDGMTWGTLKVLYR